MSLTIITNHHERDFIYGYELPESVRADFDYLDADEIDFHDFIKYRGVYYDPGEFMRCNGVIDPDFTGWHGYAPDSFFSGVLIRYSDDCERYTIATYMC